MSKFRYFIFRLNHDKRAVIIKNIVRNVPESFRLRKGEKMGSKFSSATVLNFFPEGGDMITDFINNINRCVIISSKVKDVFMEEGLDDDKVEYLPFILHDKKGRTVSAQYYFANSLANINCFDYDNSKHTRSSNTGDLLDVETIELKKDKIDDNAKFFRIGEYPACIVIRSDLLDKLESHGFTGISVVGTGEELI